MSDQIYQGFLKRQEEAARAFAAESDLVTITPGGGDPPCVYRVHYDCTCLVRDPHGQIREHEGFGVRICFPLDYLRVVEPFRVVNFLYPRNVFHPNVLPQAFAICVGRLEPGQELIDLIHQCWAIATWNKATVNERDALNRDACLFGRRTQRGPVDVRPLKRAVADFGIIVSNPAVSA